MALRLGFWALLRTSTVVSKDSRVRISQPLSLFFFGAWFFFTAIDILILMLILCTIFTEHIYDLIFTFVTHNLVYHTSLRTSSGNYKIVYHLQLLIAAVPNQSIFDQ